MTFLHIFSNLLFDLKHQPDTVYGMKKELIKFQKGKEKERRKGIELP